MSNPKISVIIPVYNAESTLRRCVDSVLAQTKLTEILYIFFGIHTANVVQLADRIEQRGHLVVA